MIDDRIATPDNLSISGCSAGLVGSARQFAGSSERPPHIREVVSLRRQVTSPDIGDVMVVRCYEQGKWTAQLQ